MFKSYRLIKKKELNSSSLNLPFGVYVMIMSHQPQRIQPSAAIISIIFIVQDPLYLPYDFSFIFLMLFTS